jgi:hypothetical protein
MNESSAARAARRRRRLLLAALAVALLGSMTAVSAHGVSPRDARFVASVTGSAPAPFAYLGAKHMVTGYDHLLFLVGVIFFLHRLGDVVKYVSLFTLGHSATLLAGVLGDVRANAYLIDAVIGLSVVYKGFENVGGFQRVFGVRPAPQAAVLVFGLFHGFGLATKLQELSLPAPGLVANLVSFNVGVELGQGLALAGILIALTHWRSRASFSRHAFTANTVLMTGGFLLVGFQLAGYLLTS